MGKKPPLYPHIPKSQMEKGKTPLETAYSPPTEYQIPITLIVRAKDEGGVISLVRQLERRAGWKPILPIEFKRIGIGEISKI